MSRGPGRVERAIQAAFQAEPTEGFTVKRLAQIVYHAGSTTAAITEPERQSVARAARKVAKRLGWKSERTHISVPIAERCGEWPGQYVRYDQPHALALKRKREYREKRGLPPEPTPEEVEAAKPERIKRSEKRNAEEAAIKREMLDDYRRLKAKHEALDIERDEIDAAMELIVARSRLGNG